MSRTPRTFADHLRELRQRILVSVVLFLIGGTIGYILHAQLLQLIQTPLHQTLYYTTPAGAFNLTMKLSFLGGVVLLLPAVVYNLAAFVQPALQRSLGRGALRLMTLLSLVLAAAGAAFAYYVVVPMSLGFFRQFDQKGFQSLISATDYVNFVVNCLIAFVIIFQLPLFLLFIDRVKPLPPKRLWYYERHVVVASLVIALVLPFTYDPLTQFMIALPIILLYNLSIIFILLTHRSQRRRHEKSSVVHIRPAAKPSIPVPAAAPAPARRTALIADAAAARPRVAGPHVLPARSVDGMVRPAHVRPGQHLPADAIPHSHPAPAPRPGLIRDIVALPSVRSAQYHRRGSAAYSRALAIPGIDMRPRLAAENS